MQDEPSRTSLVFHLNKKAMVNNTTSTGLGSEQSLTDDSIGAMIFIVFVLLWYASSVVFLMGMQMGRSNEIFNYTAECSSKLFVQGFRDQSEHKEILEELVDKQKRDKLWDIYLGTSGDMNDKLTRAETLRIRHIEKRLARLNSDSQCSLIRSYSHPWSSTNNVSSSSPRLRPRRRSSIDYQILEEWKLMTNELKTHENWPWAIQKLLIRRHLRRQRHEIEC